MYASYVYNNSQFHVRVALSLWIGVYTVQRWQTFNFAQCLIRGSGVFVLLVLLAISFLKNTNKLQEICLIIGFWYVGITYILMSIFGTYTPSGFLVFPFFSMALSTIRFKYAAPLTWILSLCMCGFLIARSEYQGLLLSYLILLSSISSIAGYNIHKSRRKYFLLATCVQQEKEKSENKLQKLLPARVALKLKEVSGSVVFQFKNVGMAAAVLTNFQEIVAGMSADNTVLLLNDIFSQFDLLVECHSLCRIKTVGSTYVYAQGLNLDGGSIADDLGSALRCAYKMQDAIRNFNSKHFTDLKLTIIVHYGNMLTGVIGASKFRVDVWGEDINYTYKLAEQFCNNDDNNNNNTLPKNPILVSAQAHTIVVDEFEFGDINIGDEKIHFLKKIATESICFEEEKLSYGSTPCNSVVEMSSVSVEIIREDSEPM